MVSERRRSSVIIIALILICLEEVIDNTYLLDQQFPDQVLLISILGIFERPVGQFGWLRIIRSGLYWFFQAIWQVFKLGKYL